VDNERNFSLFANLVLLKNLGIAYGRAVYVQGERTYLSPAKPAFLDKRKNTVWIQQLDALCCPTLAGRSVA
jgi:hypothetical protein